MTTTMGPQPRRNPNLSTEPELITQEESEPTTGKTSRDPPQNPPDQEMESTCDSEPNSVEKPSSSKHSSVPYAIPQWSEPPSHHFFLEVLEEGCVIDQLKVYEKGAYMFGSVDLCDVVLEHPTISRFHAGDEKDLCGRTFPFDFAYSFDWYLLQREKAVSILELNLH
ncbi:hypothetical protein QQP08_004442 [Theobroma cacao]|nr:hypothetical protein QQP08_004442 [Theobroma cacao]